MSKRSFFTFLIVIAISLSGMIGGIMRAQAEDICLFDIEAWVFQGEPEDQSNPLQGVTVRLYASDDPYPALDTRVLIDTQVTDSFGHVFLGVNLGEEGYANYFIIEENLSGYISTGATSASGEVINFDVIQLTNPLIHKNLVDNKFWDDLKPPSFVFSGNVYQGQVGDTTTPIPGVTVTLYGSSSPFPASLTNPLDSAVTDAAGAYSIELAEDTFAYYFLVETNLAGYFSVGALSVDGTVVTPDQIQFASPLPSHDLHGNDFWDDLSPTGFTFTGNVYQGLVGVTTTPIPGVTVTLYGSSSPYPSSLSNPLGSAVTDAAGAYSIALAADTFAYYFVVEQNLANYYSVGAQSAGGSVMTSDLIQFTGPLPGQNLTGNNFWDDLAPTSFTFTGNVYQGQVGVTTTPLAGVTVQLFGSPSPFPSNQMTLLGTTATDSTGAYSLPLSLDTYAYYFILEQNLQGYASVGAQSIAGTVVNPDQIEIASPLPGKNLNGNNFWDDISTYDFIFTGFVYLGQYGDISQPIGGIPIRLYGSSIPFPNDAATLIANTVTEIDGSFSIPLDQDTFAYYWLTEQTPLGYFSAAAITIGGTVINTDVIQFSSPLLGLNLTGNIFWDDITSCLASFTGRVFQGQSGDTTVPIAGVTVSVYGSNTPYPATQTTLIGSSVTDSIGSFRIPLTEDNFPYYFLIEENLPGYVSTGASAISGMIITPDIIQFVGPLPGQNLSATKFWDVVSTNATTISGSIFQGETNQSTTPLSGAQVNLFGSNSPYPSTSTTLLTSGITGANGSYNLTLTPSQEIYSYYFLVVPGSTGYTPSGATSASGTVVDTNTIQFVSLAPGQNLVSNVFYATPAAPTSFRMWLPELNTPWNRPLPPGEIPYDPNKP